MLKSILVDGLPQAPVSQDIQISLEKENQGIGKERLLNLPGRRNTAAKPHSHSQLILQCRTPKERIAMSSESLHSKSSPSV